MAVTNGLVETDGPAVDHDRMRCPIGSADRFVDSAVTRRRALAIAGTAYAGCYGMGGRGSATEIAAESTDSGRSVLRLGVIGCGGRGTLAAVGLLSEAPAARVVAVADRHPAAMELAAGYLGRMHGTRGVCPANARFAGDSGWQRVFDADPDVVILATPAADRPEQIRRAVSQGVPMFCERPAAASLDEVEGLLPAADEADARGLAIQTALALRHDVRVCAEVDRVTRLSGPTYSSLTVWYPVPERASAGVARWTTEELVIDAIDLALWVTGDRRVERLRVVRSPGATGSPRATLECADGRIVELVPVRPSTDPFAATPVPRIMAAGKDPARVSRSHRALIAQIANPAGTTDSPYGGRTELGRLLEATRLAIAVASASG